jgi:hypothetical protein
VRAGSTRETRSDASAPLQGALPCPTTKAEKNYMNVRIFGHFLLLTGLWLFGAAGIQAQKMTTVKGKVLDGATGEGLPFVNISFIGTSVGTTTDLDGSFLLESKWASDSILVSFLGYKSFRLGVIIGDRQEVSISLVPVSINISTVEVRAKKGRYKRKGNPAVELMKAVIDHKDSNRMESMAFYEMDKYEKIQFDINNFDPEKLRRKRAFRKFQFLFDYVDTSDLNGKPFLPFFIQESVSKVYYRKDPQARKEHRDGVKVTGMEEYVDLQDLTTMLEVLYQQVNIYDDNIRILDLPFMSPLSPLANTFYRYYIMDTLVMVNDYPCTKVSFMPVNNQNIAFKGDLFILRDSSYALVKADLGITRQINLNFVQDLRLLQEFERTGSVWTLKNDVLRIDFSPLKKGTGVYGTRRVSYRDFLFDEPQDDSVYAGTEKIVDATDAYRRPETYWETARHDTLTEREANIYQMVDTLKQAPAFKNMLNVLSLLGTGFKAVGPVDLGPLAAFSSFNPVEGLRFKVSGETNLKMHPKMMVGGYLAYGLQDEEWKYGMSYLYSFRDNFKQNPKHFIRLAYQKELNLVGQQLEFYRPDNFFLSFQRGVIDRMLLIEKYSAEYNLELDNNLTWRFLFFHADQQPRGSLDLRRFNRELQESEPVADINVSEFGLHLRFAPNEQYVQGRSYRSPFYNRHPVFNLKLHVGVDGFLGGQYDYFNASFNVSKRFYLSLLGTMKVDAEAGKYWGTGIPYFMLYLPRANQSYVYRLASFNMMNYQEFVSDEYAWIMAEHNFNGLFLNKVPLLRKLKLREVITFKTILGRLTPANNPLLNSEYIQFIRNPDGSSVSYTLQEKPYMEATVGIGNIARFLRIDVIRRLNYLDNPDVPILFGVKGLGLRVRVKVEF